MTQNRVFLAGEPAHDVSGLTPWQMCVATYKRNTGMHLYQGTGASATGVPAMVNRILAYCYRNACSDVHFELSRYLHVRARRHGELCSLCQVNLSIGSMIIERLKVMAGLPFDSGVRASGGRLEFSVDGVGLIQARVSIVPIATGVRLVVRLLDSGRFADLPGLALSQQSVSEYMQLARQPGLVLIGGPAGSGKTTTLYASLASLAREAVNVICVEDPVETLLSGVSQIEASERSGVSFQTALKTILRQDPDVIGIGEIRDPDSASAACRAALTGRPVIATIHALDAPGAVYRLMDLGVSRQIVASAVTGAVSQRIVRATCPCHGRHICTICGGSQIRRAALFEVLPLSHVMRQAIARDMSLSDFRLLVTRLDHRSLEDEARNAVSEGLICLSSTKSVLEGIVCE